MNPHPPNIPDYPPPAGGLPSATSGVPSAHSPLLTASADDEGNAECVNHLYGDYFRYSPIYGWLWYNDRHWTPNTGLARVNRAIIHVLRLRHQAALEHDKKPIIQVTTCSAARKNSTRMQLQDMLTTDVESFDRQPDLLNCANGLLDLRSGERRPHQPAQQLTYCLPVPYVAEAAGVEWRQFLAQAVGGGAAALDYLQMAVGYGLTGQTVENAMFYIHGPTRSGKGTFTDTLLALFGEPLATEVDFTTFTAARYGDTQNFDLAGLKPCRFVAASEGQRHQQLNAAKIKQLTGDNRVRCAFKGRDMFTYQPQFKIWLSSNFAVNMDVDDDAAWGRLRVFHFPNSFLGREDRWLKQRLSRPDSLQGILAWAVEGARRWYAAANGLRPPAIIAANARAERAALDYVGHFLEEHYELVTNHREIETRRAWLLSSHVYQTYRAWCEAEGIRPRQQRGLVEALKSRGCDLGRRRVSNQLQRCILGLLEKQPETPNIKV